MENIMEYPQKIKDRTTIWAHNFTSYIVPKGKENTNLKKYLCPHVHSIIYNSQNMETS